MSTGGRELTPADYSPVLQEYVRTHSEDALYRASILSQSCIEGGLGPEDIVALHFETLDQLLPDYSYREHARVIGDAHQFLLEVMIAYGVKYKEYLELKLKEGLRDAEVRMMQERERAMEAERIQREKSEILGVIAHELRTPITVARGNLDLASRSLLAGKIDPVTGLLVTAKEALDRLSRLSADLVEASRGEIPPMEVSAQDLGVIAGQACSWIRPLAESKGIAFTQVMEPGQYRVMGNQDALLSVLGNLLSNAVRYTPGGGAVTASVGREGDKAWVSVQDTGIGMSPEVKARIFEKFYRGPEARAVEAKGLGLGLSLVRQILDSLGGRIEVSSAPGQGSRFRILLPLAEPVAPEDAVPAHDPGQPG